MKILLVCALGMSSSLLVKSMEDAAKDMGIDVEVKAIPCALFGEERPRIEEYDIVLLGPQVRHFRSAVEEALKNHPKIPLQIIDHTIYALAQGKKLMEEVLETLRRSPK